MARTRCLALTVIIFRAIVLMSASTLAVLAEENSSAVTDTGQKLPVTSSTALKDFDWVDTSSPRATLNSFLQGENRYYDLIRDNGYTWENRRELSNILQQSERLFDLREVPPGHRPSVAHEITALIREALARVPLPDINSIPNEDEMAKRVADGKSALYRVPGTPFEITRIDSGPDTGRYQFSQASVEHAPDFYDEIKHYPYQSDQAQVAGLYDIYFLSPGPLIPRAWIEALPRWMKIEILDNRAWQWLMLVVVVVLFILLLISLSNFINRISQDWSRLKRTLILLLRPLSIIALTMLFADFLDQHVRLTGEIARGVAFTKHLFILFASVSLTLMLASVLAEMALSGRALRYQQLDQQLIRLLIRLVSVAVAVVIVIEEMQQVGFSIATLVAGAGVSGLAVALAAQGALKNIFGGIELALDKPFEVGQRVKMSGYEGVVEEIGLRSTKLRTLDGNQITIPNEQVANIDLENVGRRPHIRRRFDITIPYETPVEKINQAVEIVQEILSVPETAVTDDRQQEPHPNEAINKEDYLPRVYFNELNPDTLNILVLYWYHPPDRWLYYEHAHSINTQIVERFNAAGINFAFPSQTIYLADDDKRPLTIQSKGQST